MCKKAVGTGKTERTALKAAEPEKRVFSLPYISHNVHYTKYYNVQKTDPLLSPRGCGSDPADAVQNSQKVCGIILTEFFSGTRILSVSDDSGPKDHSGSGVVPK